MSSSSHGRPSSTSCVTVPKATCAAPTAAANLSLHCHADFGYFQTDRQTKLLAKVAGCSVGRLPAEPPAYATLSSLHSLSACGSLQRIPPSLRAAWRGCRAPWSARCAPSGPRTGPARGGSCLTTMLSTHVCRMRHGPCGMGPCRILARQRSQEAWQHGTAKTSPPTALSKPRPDSSVLASTIRSRAGVTTPACMRRGVEEVAE